MVNKGEGEKTSIYAANPWMLGEKPHPCQQGIYSEAVRTNGHCVTGAHPAPHATETLTCVREREHRLVPAELPPTGEADPRGDARSLPETTGQLVVVSSRADG